MHVSIGRSKQSGWKQTLLSKWKIPRPRLKSSSWHSPLALLRIVWALLLNKMLFSRFHAAPPVSYNDERPPSSVFCCHRWFWVGSEMKTCWNLLQLKHEYRQFLPKSRHQLYYYIQRIVCLSTCILRIIATSAKEARLFTNPRNYAWRNVGGQAYFDS